MSEVWKANKTKCHAFFSYENKDNQLQHFGFPMFNNNCSNRNLIEEEVKKKEKKEICLKMWIVALKREVDDDKRNLMI